MTFHRWKSVIHASYKLVTTTWRRLLTQSFLGVSSERRGTSIEWFFKMVGGNKGKILNSLKNHIGKQIFADEKSGHHSRTQDNRTEAG